MPETLERTCGTSLASDVVETLTVINSHGRSAPVAVPVPESLIKSDHASDFVLEPHNVRSAFSRRPRPPVRGMTEN